MCDYSYYEDEESTREGLLVGVPSFRIVRKAMLCFTERIRTSTGFRFPKKDERKVDGETPSARV